jgi:hypothetical protein
LFSISFAILLAERFLSAAQQTPDIVGTDFEGGGDFQVAEALTAEKEQRSLPLRNGAEYCADVLPLGIGRA